MIREPDDAPETLGYLVLAGLALVVGLVALHVICAGAKSTTGKCFLFFPLVPACKQTSGSILKALCFAPVPILSLLAVHAVNLAKDQKHEVPKSREF
ncbi:hypothetical protein NL532_24255 [Mesorhizobium sp. C120A]|uniref:hypothetical protein n=1 Tax=unclassified Mesorhizobium TaxID=325217 RepID=UPI0003D04ADE|nr:MULTISPECIES: hypothetical protein [unclassified Mesorhizobium]ESZ60678.1 hypothetical protein X728_15205 [Mesorhizobium sp. L103C120A0]WJI43723.1 hypothetical protein NL532_24255 [Mesorhizobium sp. C120A]